MASINLRTFQGNVGNLRGVKSVKTAKAEQLAEKEGKELKGKTTVQDLNEPQVNKYKKPSRPPKDDFDFVFTQEDGSYIDWIADVTKMAIYIGRLPK